MHCHSVFIAANQAVGTKQPLACMPGHHSLCQSVQKLWQSHHQSQPGPVHSNSKTCELDADKADCTLSVFTTSSWQAVSVSATSRSDLSNGCCECCFAVVYVAYRADVQVLLCSSVDIISRGCKAPPQAYSRQAIMGLCVEPAYIVSLQLSLFSGPEDRKQTCIQSPCRSIP